MGFSLSKLNKMDAPIQTTPLVPAEIPPQVLPTPVPAEITPPVPATPKTNFLTPPSTEQERPKLKHNFFYQLGRLC
jgi:hypothetical protein